MTKRATMLIADDAEINRAILRGLFEDEFDLLEAENGYQALLLLQQYSGTISTVLLDLVMPEISGYEVLEEMEKSEQLSHIPVVVITADDSSGSKVRVFELGASDIITKPFDPDVVKSRVKNILELSRYRQHLEELVEEQAARARETSSAVIGLLSSVIEHRSLESGQHIRRIGMFTQSLLEVVAESFGEYDLNERKIQLIVDASSMHDIGKIAIPDRILNKPGKLTDEEFEIMKTHTTKGCEILSGLDRLQDKEYLQYAYLICRHHHERWDGRGYPDGLKGDSIPLCAQVVAIADCYDALTTDRVYKKAIPPNEAFNMILNGECGTFSPRLMECFKNVREPFARLSRDYADGRVLPAGPPKPTSGVEHSPIYQLSENALEQSRLRYFAMLRYADTTVMEVDLGTGVYHVVYLSDQDFSSLRGGGQFEESIRAFAEISVHEDDREEFLKILGGYTDELFAEGLTRRSRRYRVRSRDTGGFFWCRASIMRVDMENPRSRKLLFLWKKEEEVDGAAALCKCPEDMGGELIVERLLDGFQKRRNDRYLTLIQVNQRFCDLVGYSRGEIEEKFENRYIDMVYPSDREKLAQQFHEQLVSGRTAELGYRLVAKDGRIIWASDRCILEEEDGEEYIYSMLLDVTKSRLAEEELRLSMEKHQIIMDQTNDIIFEWDIPTDQLIMSSNWQMQYGYSPVSENASREIVRNSHINPDDLSGMSDFIEAMSAGVPYKEVEFRLLDNTGKYRWRRARATAQFDGDGKPFRAIGVLIDIDDQKRISAELEDKARRDALTGLYNKNAARLRIEKYLDACGRDDACAMMIVDVDDFKRINDRYGHMFGDAVLVELAVRISNLFRYEDTVARIGGDEFLIFMPNVRSAETVEHRSAQLVDEFKEMLHNKNDGGKLSCSVGICFAAGNGNYFGGMFEKADRALYRAKAAGKDRYMFYNDEMGGGNVGMGAQEPRTRIDSERASGWSGQNLMIRAFESICSVSNLGQAVGALLGMVGELLRVTRAYVFETAADGRNCVKTFEWSRSDAKHLPNIPDSMRLVFNGSDYRDNFNDKGVFYCSDIGGLPAWQSVELASGGARSLLQCAIMDGKEFKGFVGFDDCSEHRLWTRDETDALSFIGKLLTIFLPHKRERDELESALKNIDGVLESLPSSLYVLDKETYRLLYLNGGTRCGAPGAALGDVCYRALAGRETPCEDCVMQAAASHGGRASKLMLDAGGKAMLADAAMIDWEARQACMVSHREIPLEENE